jgi:hypothetical protein
MRPDFSSTKDWTDEDRRLTRMAQHTRIVAVALIVGVIVMAAVESAPVSEGVGSTDAAHEATRARAVMQLPAAPSPADRVAPSGGAAKGITEWPLPPYEPEYEVYG